MEKYNLEELCSIITDGTHQTPKYSENGYIFLSSKDVTTRKINWEKAKRIPKQLHEALSARLKPKINDILLAKNGTTGVAAIVDRDEDFDIYVSLALLRPKEIVYPKYLLYAVNSPQAKRQFDRGLKGIGVPNLHLGVIRKAKIPLPQYEIQQKIVKQLEMVDKLIEIQKEQLEQYDALIKARFVEMFGELEYNTKKWPIVKLEKLCKIGSSKRIYQNEQSETGIPFLRISDLIDRLDTGSKDCDLYIPKERFEELKSQGLVPEIGDILVTARGTLGRCYIITDEDEFYFQDGMITWLSKFSNSITPLFISYLFSTLEFKKQIDGLQAGSTVAYLSIAMTKKLDIMVPPMKLQTQFADFVHQVKKLKVEEQRKLEKTQILFDSLMQQYFG